MMDELFKQKTGLTSANNTNIMSGIELGRDESEKRIKELEGDIMVLVGRLYEEDEATFAPDTWAIMHKWRSKFEALLKGG